NLTQANVVMGTPDYLAPEQALDPRCADARSDLYALGCTLHFLLTARPPFPVEATLAQKLLYHQQVAPPPVQTARPDVPPSVAPSLVDSRADGSERGFTLMAESLPPPSSAPVAPPTLVQRPASTRIVPAAVAHELTGRRWLIGLGVAVGGAAAMLFLVLG